MCIYSSYVGEGVYTYLYPAKSDKGLSSHNRINNVITDRDAVINNHMCACRSPSLSDTGTCMLILLVIMSIRKRKHDYSTSTRSLSSTCLLSSEIYRIIFLRHLNAIVFTWLIARSFSIELLISHFLFN